MALQLGWRDYVLIVLAGLLVGFVMTDATHYSYELLIWEIGIIVAVVMFIISHFFIAALKVLSLLLLFILLVFAGAAAATYVYIHP